MKKISCLILALVLVLGLVACAPAATSQPAAPSQAQSSEPAVEAAPTQQSAEEVNTDPIIVGSIQDISGTTSVMGYAINEGVKMAVDNCNANGGINGRQLQLLEYDSKGTVDEAIKAFTRLNTEGAIAVIAPHTSNIGIAFAPLAEAANTPTLTLGIDNRVTRKGEDGTGEVQPYMFTMQPAVVSQVTIMAKYLLDDCGYTKMGILYNIDNASQTMQSEMFKEYCESHGVEIKKIISFQSADTDYKTMLTQLINEDLECIFSPGYTQELVVQVQQARQLGYTGPIMVGIDGTPPFSELCGDAANGVLYINNVDLSNQKVLDLIQQYAAQTGNEPNQINKFCLGYDMMSCIISAITEVGADKAAIREYMENLNGYEAVTGTININPKTHQPYGMSMVVYEVKDGKNVPMKETFED